MAVELREPTRDDIEELVARIRPMDRLECECMGFTVDAMVRASIDGSIACQAMLIDGQLAAIGGVGAPPGGFIDRHDAPGWLLTTDTVALYPVAFHRAVRQWLLMASALVDSVWALVHADYSVSIKWLERLGFSLGPVLPCGPNRARFIYAHKGL